MGRAVVNFDAKNSPFSGTKSPISNIEETKSYLQKSHDKIQNESEGVVKISDIVSEARNVNVQGRNSNLGGVSKTDGETVNYGGLSTGPNFYKATIVHSEADQTQEFIASIKQSIDEVHERINNFS